MFQNTRASISSLAPAQNWNVKFKNLSNTFYFPRNLTSLDLSNWDVSDCTDFTGMFYQIKLETLGVSNWDVGSANTFIMMFNKASNFNEDLSAWRPYIRILRKCLIVLLNLTLQLMIGCAPVPQILILCLINRDSISL